MGFTIGAIATKALLGIKGPYTVKSVNTAFLGVKDFKTDILCKPWYYGKAPLHIPNNTDRTVVAAGRQDGPEGGLLPDLRRGPGHRAGPQDRGEPAVGVAKSNSTRYT